MWQQGAAYYWEGGDGQHHCKHSTKVRTLVDVFSVEVLTVSIATIIVPLTEEEMSALMTVYARIVSLMHNIYLSLLVTKAPYTIIAADRTWLSVRRRVCLIPRQRS